MSASNKKKLRKEEHMAKLTERQQAEQKEAKKLKINTAIFVAGIALVLVIGVALLAWNLYSNSGIRERTTKAVQIGNHTLTAADLNYYYIDLLNETQGDSSALSTLSSGEGGLTYSTPLSKQPYKTEEGKTWGDYFIEQAINEAAGVLALCDAAKEAGFTMSAEDVAAVDDTILAMETQGMLYGYKKLDTFLQAIYGKGAKTSSYRTYVENVTLAQSYYNHYTESLTYDAEDIANYEKENGSYSSFTYTYFQVTPDTFMEHEEGSTEHNHSEEDQAAALQAAKETADALVASGATNKEELDNAIASLTVYNPNAGTEEETAEEETTEEETTEEETTEEETTEEETTEEETTEEETTEEETTEEETTEEETTEEETTEEETTEAATSTVPTSVEHTEYSYSYINSAIAEWLTASEHKAGDIAAVPYYTLDADGNKTDVIESYYVVIFGNENKHDENMVTVRHILKSYTGGTVDEESGATTYSDEEKQAAEDAINEIKAEWEKGEKTEDSFAELAKTHTDDSNAEEGGLYENIYRGWAMAEFDAWCFDESRKPGDVGVVHTEYGCHMIYFVTEEDETYHDYMVTYDMRASDSADWFDALKENYNSTAKVLNTSLLNTDVTITPNYSLY